MSVHDVKAMSDEELMDAWTALGEHAAEVKDRLRLFSAEHQERTERAQLSAQLGLADASPEERARIVALIQSAGPTGIESAEVVGEVS